MNCFTSIHRYILALLVGGFTTVTLSGGEFNKVLSIGDAAPAWVNLPGTDGKLHSLSDLASKKVVVVLFTCCSCPIANDYEPRIATLAKKFISAETGENEKSVAFVAINVNKTKEDSLPEMTKRAAKQQYDYPFLFDETQQIAKKYGAVYTPEFFVLNADRKIVYLGAMDEKNPPAPAGRLFLEEAIRAALREEQPEVKETLGRGCRIRYTR